MAWRIARSTRLAEELLDLIARHRPDVVVMDLMLSGMDGLEVHALKIPQNPPHGKKVFHIFSNYFSTTLVIIRPHTDFQNQKTRNYNQLSHCRSIRPTQMP